MKPIRFPTRNSKAGQQENVCRALQENLDALYSMARKVTGTRELAEDLVQETARKALEGAARLTHEKHLRAWLFRILLNNIRDYLRRKKLWAEAEIEELEAQTWSADVFSMATSIDVQNALAALPAAGRAVILLIDVEEFTILEAASILGVPPGTVCSRLARARSQLFQHLKMYRGRAFEQGGRS